MTSRSLSGPIIAGRPRRRRRSRYSSLAERPIYAARFQLAGVATAEREGSRSGRPRCECHASCHAARSLVRGGGSGSAVCYPLLPSTAWEGRHVGIRVEFGAMNAQETLQRFRAKKTAAEAQVVRWGRRSALTSRGPASSPPTSKKSCTGNTVSATMSLIAHSVMTRSCPRPDMLPRN